MARDFFERQESARKKTGWLVIILILGLAVLNLVIYLSVVFLFTAFRRGPVRVDQGDEWLQAFYQPDVFWVTVPLVSGVIVLCSLYRMFTLRGGGQKVAESLGGVLIRPDTTNPHELRLVNVVEEMAIASGMPVPPVYCLPGERGINAFAAGFTTRDAVIGVNRGTIECLTRDELQGVIAHEFSHILNGDMRLNLRLMGVLFGLIALGLFGRLLIRIASRSTSSDDNKGFFHFFAFGIVLAVLGYVGHLVSALIKAAISRQREFLADASAVQFTRNPDGIAGALKKIGGYGEGSEIKNPSAEEVSHMFFALPFSSGFAKFFSTHPPLLERIKAIDPGFDGRFPRVSYLPVAELDAGISSFSSGLESEKGLPERVVDRVGMLDWERVLLSRKILDSIPKPLITAAKEPHGAASVIFALLVDSSDAQIRNRQLNLIDRQFSYGVPREVARVFTLVQNLDPALKLPLVELALPSLRQLSASQYSSFNSVVRALTAIDNNISVFDYVLQVVLLRSLEPIYQGRISARVKYRSLSQVKDSIATLLSVLAAASAQREGGSVGKNDDVKKVFTFTQGASLIRGIEEGDFEDLGICLRSLDKALGRLSLSSPAIKKKVVTAASASITSDKKVTVVELELLRAVCESLDCPIPPFLETFDRDQGHD